MPATLCLLHPLSPLSFQKSYAVGTVIIVCTLKMRKQKPRKVKLLGQSYTAKKMESQDSQLQPPD